MSGLPHATDMPCATGCGVVVRQRSVGTPICAECIVLAERIFRRDHSPLDRDWQVQRNRFFGKGETIVRAVLAERGLMVV